MNPVQLGPRTGEFSRRVKGRSLAAIDDIKQGLDEVARSAFVGGHTKKSYEDSNPTESQKVFSYLEGGAIPNPLPSTLMGSGLVKIEKGRRALATPALPSNVSRSQATQVVTA